LKKIFTSLRSIIPVPNGKTKFCKTCGNTATQEALFNVDGDITVIERYCETCAIKKMQPLETRN
jgi:MinD superfamily P-loop ATPase